MEMEMKCRHSLCGWMDFNRVSYYLYACDDDDDGRSLSIYLSSSSSSHTVVVVVVVVILIIISFPIRVTRFDDGTTTLSRFHHASRMTTRFDRSIVRSVFVCPADHIVVYTYLTVYEWWSFWFMDE
jgi:hypothetical protein